jgi:abortive infection bacteriophage resistance protein
MDVGDRSTAEITLRTIGYSRLKAYTYPFRMPLPSNSAQETPYQMRGKDFFRGTRLEHATALYKFDQNLRRICLDGLQHLEISFRGAIAHTLGKRSQFAHLDTAHLDTGACTALDTEGKAAWDHWLKTYREARAQGKEEDFVAHHLIKYGNDLPIWLTTEILTFGSLVRLFSLLVDSDKTAVARYFGVTDGRRLHKWLLAMNGLRNVCAHHHRLWNRILTYELKVPPATVGPNWPICRHSQRRSASMTHTGPSQLPLEVPRLGQSVARDPEDTTQEVPESKRTADRGWPSRA